MNNSDIKPWIQLNMITGIGPMRFATLLKHFGSPQAILSANASNLSQVKGIGPQLAQRIIEEKDKVKVDAELEKVEKEGVTVLTLDSEDYPMNLKSIYDPPPVLYLKGKLQPDDRLSIAMVGSRAATTYGKTIAERLAAELVHAGFTIISGLARGIDVASHRSAIDSNGRTIAVLGCGIDIIYPPENKKLFYEIIEHGAIITEFPIGTPPEKFNFPQRNRIISGLSLGTVIVEAPLKSGALITADCALEQNREVFAVPGSVGSRLSQGTHQLIKQGAKLTESAEDIIEELELFRDALKNIPQVKKNTEIALSTDEDKLYQFISSIEPQHIDTISCLSQMTAAQVAGVLIQLEIKGVIKQLMGKRFIRC
ncbi:MAG: DNA-processing protein DprA [Nitrospirota bacterium]